MRGSLHFSILAVGGTKGCHAEMPKISVLSRSRMSALWSPGLSSRVR